MLEVIALWFLTKEVGKIALRKGEKPSRWKLFTVLAWFGAEFAGFLLAVMLFGTGNLIGLFLIGMMCAIGGYLVVKAQLSKLPDQADDDIDRIGSGY